MTDDEIKKLAEATVDDRIRVLKGYCAAFGACLAFMGAIGFAWDDLRLFLFAKAYPPEIVYDGLKEKIRNDPEMRAAIKFDIVNLISERVDSGYTRVIYFGPGAATQPGQDVLQFYAREKQKIELTLYAHGDHAPEAEFIVTVDNKNIYALVGRKNPKLTERLVAIDVTKFLVFADDPMAQKEERNLHTVRVRPINLPQEAAAAFELLVLVRNAKLDES